MRVAIVFLFAAAAALPVAAQEGPLLTGADAFGGWDKSAPGVGRLIRPEDLPAPFATSSAFNAPGLVRRPAGAAPKVGTGFNVTLLADGFSQPRVVRTAPNGDLFVADSGADKIVVLRLDRAGKVAERGVFAEGLNQPYGIGFYPPADPKWVYVGNADSVVRFPYRAGDLQAEGAPQTVVADIPPYGHWTRDIAFSPDGKTLYLAVGSGTNAGEDLASPPPEGVAAFASGHAPGELWGMEKGRAAVIAFDPDGSNRRVFATGIRNCSGIAVEPETAKPWCVTNERDGLGDNLVPDYATSLSAGAFYGWPWFYIGNNEDPRPPLKGQRPDLAGRVAIPDVLFQAHSAPLGIAFYQGTMFPAVYAGGAFVTMHGSWNRGQRTGYKVVWLPFRDGRPTGAYVDFVTGFVQSADLVWGRPVGVTVAGDGALIVSEDGDGTLWRVTYGGPP